MKHYKLVEFLSNLNVKPPPHERKSPPHKCKAPIDDFLATVLAAAQLRKSQDHQGSKRAIHEP